MSKAPASSLKKRGHDAASGSGHLEQGVVDTEAHRVVFYCQSGEGKALREQFGCGDRVEHFALLAGVARGSPAAIIAKGDGSIQRLAQLVREEQICSDTVLVVTGVQSAAPALLASLRTVGRKFPLAFEFTTSCGLKHDRGKVPSYLLTKVRLL